MTTIAEQLIELNDVKQEMRRAINDFTGEEAVTSFTPFDQYASIIRANSSVGHEDIRDMISITGDVSDGTFNHVEKVIISDVVNYIPAGFLQGGRGNSLFNYCKGLIILGDVSVIEGYGLAYFQQAKTLEFKGTVGEIWRYAFTGWGALEELELPEGLTWISDNAFDQSRLTRLVLPSTLQHIGASAFSSILRLGSLVLPESLDFIGDYAFGELSGFDASDELVLPGSLKYIGRYAFRFLDGITSLIVSEGVETIEYSAFWRLTTISELVLPSTLKVLGDYSFYSVTADRIYCYAEVPPTASGQYFFWSTPNDTLKLYVPAGSVEAYKTAPYWSVYEQWIYPMPE